MDYEKAYKDALERAKNLYSGVHKGCKEVIDNIFPELKESEDERTRKDLIEFLTDVNRNYKLIPARYMDWLEKHKKQKPAEWSYEETKDLVHILRVLDDCYAYGKHDLSKTDHDNLTSRIKFLRPSWKPNDKDEERLINTSISFLKDFADKGYENAVECIDFLKSKLNGNSGK